AGWGARAGARAAAGIALALAAAACGAAPMRVAAIDEMERVRTAAGAKGGAALAPEADARAELERRLSREEHTKGGDGGAARHAQGAVAAYEHAFAVARLARATTELVDAQRTLGDATAQAQDIEASRVRLEREAAELEDRVRVARERMLPASAAAATGER